MSQDHHTTLKNLRMRVTPKRLAILEILGDARVFLSPEEVWQRMKIRFKRIGLPTVYRNLEELGGGMIISKVLLPDRQLYYCLCRNPRHHHHFVCLSCRRVEDVHTCAFEEIEKEVRRFKGTVISHILQINGLCSECSKSKATCHES